jgi:hypothetical protein
MEPDTSSFPGQFRVVENRGRRCNVDGWNAAAEASTGDLLIQVADDVRPPPKWDRLLLREMPADHKTRDYVLVLPGLNGWQRHAFMSRTRYLRRGYMLYPGYESIYSDDDWFEHAWADQVVVDCRKKTDLLFPHFHPAFGLAQWDEVYRQNNQEHRYHQGAVLLSVRRQTGFRDLRQLSSI